MPTHCRVKATHTLFLPPSPPSDAVTMSPPQEQTLQDMVHFLESIETQVPDDEEEGEQQQQQPPPLPLPDALVIPEHDFCLIPDLSTPPPDDGLFADLPSNH